MRAGAPPCVRLVELGPGRGTLMADLLRAARRAPGFAPAVHFVETSPMLRAEQAKRVPDARWHDRLEDVPDDAPLLLVANEFLDALPIRQFVRIEGGWRERAVALIDGRFVPLPGPTPVEALVPPAVLGAPVGTVVEACPAGEAVATEIAARLARHGGAALLIDYGYRSPATGETLQAVRAHAFADPFADPGEADLTAHVDFTAIARAARGVVVHGPIEQGAFLTALGLHPRSEALAARATAAQADLLRSGAHRLSAPDEMGSLFKALALTGPEWPIPAAFP
jgi:SAM-dependent MidA family methyltransferase